MATQTVGIIDIMWRGKKIDTEKGASFFPGGLMNNTVVAGRKLFTSQEWMNGEVECTTVFKVGDVLDDLYTTAAGELQCILDSGQTIVFANAVQIEKRPKVTAGEGGKVALKWAVAEAQVLL